MTPALEPDSQLERELGEALRNARKGVESLRSALRVAQERQTREIANAYSHGMSPTDIAWELGISREYVHRVLKNQNHE